MVRVLWFRETSRWARRGIPLRVVWVSPRQLVILASSFFLGYVLSVPSPTIAIRAAFVGAVLLMGVVAAFWRVKLLTPEQMVMMKLGIRGMPAEGASKRKVGVEQEKKEDESIFVLESESVEYLTPLTLTGKLPRLRQPRRGSLFVDGTPRPGAEALVTPVSDKESGFTIIFVPSPADIGVHELEVRVEGVSEPVYRRRVDVKAKNVRSPLEMKKLS